MTEGQESQSGNRKFEISDLDAIFHSTADDRRRMIDHYDAAARVRGQYLNKCALIEELVTLGILGALTTDDDARDWVRTNLLERTEFGRRIELLKDAVKRFHPSAYDPELFNRLGRVNKFRQTWAHGAVDDFAAVIGRLSEEHIQLTTRGNRSETIKPSDVKRRLDDADKAVTGLFTLHFQIVGLHVDIRTGRRIAKEA